MGCPFAFKSSMIDNASGILVTNMDFACNGISGRDQASVAGDKSSVLVSPVTFKTETVILSASFSRFVNHSPTAQASTICLANEFVFAFSIMLCQASAINKEVERDWVTIGASWSLSSKSTIG